MSVVCSICLMVVLGAGCAAGQMPAGTPATDDLLLDYAEEVLNPAPMNSSYGAYLAARRAELQNDTGAAAFFYQQALKNDPDNPRLLNRAYFFAGVEGNMNTAASLAERMLTAVPDDLLSPIVIASQLVKNGSVAEAKALLERVDQRGLNSFLIPVMLAWMHTELGDANTGLSALEALSETEGFDSLQQLHEALILETAGRIEDAKLRFDTYGDSDSATTLRGMQLVGGFLTRAGEVGRAQALAERYQTQFPDSLLVENATQGFDGAPPPPPLVMDAASGLAEVFYGTATLLVDNDAQTASLFANMAMHLNPDFTLAKLMVGQLLADRGRYRQSTALYRTLLDDPYLGLSAGLAIADNERAAEQIDTAATMLERLAGMYPDRSDPLVEMADLYRSAERFAEAEDAYDRAFERIETIEPRHWVLFFGRGIAYERTDQWPKAETDFQRALELEPDQPLVLNYLGYSWVDQGIRIPEAKAMIEKAVSLRPRNGFIIDSLGWAYYRLGEYENAVVHLERAVLATPDDPTINDHLGDAYWRVGRILEARFQWERALDLSEDPELSESIALKLEEGLPPPEVIGDKEPE